MNNNLSGSGSEHGLYEQGIPSVSSPHNSTVHSNIAKGFYFVGVFACMLAVLFYMFKGSDLDPEQDSSNPDLTSDLQLESSDWSKYQPPAPIPEPEPPAPEPPVAPQEEPAPEPLPVPAANDLNLNLAKEEIPSLEELKFAAPMMGKVSSNKTQDLSNIAGNRSSNQYNQYQVPLELMSQIDLDSNQEQQPSLESMLVPVETPSTSARLITNQNWILSKGTIIECILETRVDTTVQGMTSCIVPRNVYSMNGRVLLIERGSKVIGEYQGAIQNGLARIFMLWTEIRTPNGVVIQINSPVTDPLGGAGMGGYVDYHWWKRFGNALLFSIVADGFQYIVNTANENNNNGNVTYENTEDGTNEIIKEAMRQSGNIPPTLIKNQGEKVAIFVARDVNFATVYEAKRK